MGGQGAAPTRLPLTLKRPSDGGLGAFFVLICVKPGTLESGILAGMLNGPDRQRELMTGTQCHDQRRVAPDA